jgi:DnaJ-domain-containing protein 1
VDNQKLPNKTSNMLGRLFQRFRGTGAKKFIEGGFEAEMTRREAAQILSLKETAGDDEIKSAHRKLMMINHPDNGGSTFVSTKINEAKATLLGGRKK